MKNKFAKDLSIVLVGNVFVLISSILTGLVVPKIMGVTNYGYYQIYTLYLTYVALLHFGFVDGILLVHGGEKYEELDISLFRTNTKYYALIEMLLSLSAVIFSVIFLHDIYRFIGVMLGIEIFTTNMTAYYQYISQSTMRFKEWSLRKVIQAGLKIIVTSIMAMLYFFNIINYVSAQIYLSCIVVIDLLLLLWYSNTYRDISLGEGSKFNKRTFFSYFKLGIALTLAYQIAHLVLNLDRQFVSALFETDTYSIYAFAYRLLSMVTTVINAVSIVLFPNLKKKSKISGDRIMDSMPDNIAMIAISVFAVHIGYYPLQIFINWFLPDYVVALDYLKILFPGIAITCCISLIIFNYYKVLNKNILYCIISMAILFLSAILNTIAYYCYHSPKAISIASVITLFTWYMVLQVTFIKKYCIKWKKNMIYIICCSACFYFFNYILNNSILGGILYFSAYIIITVSLYKRLILHNLRKFQK